MDGAPNFIFCDRQYLNKLLPVERTGINMTNTTVLITDMAILVGIFLLGLLAKMFPKNGRHDGSKQSHQ
jgi:hypothetical protein